VRARSDINALSPPELFDHFAATGLVRRVLELAADEDLGPETLDITTEVCVAPDRRARAVVASRSAGVVAGLAAVPMLLQTFATGVRAKVSVRDGSAIRAGSILAELSGPLDEILAVERTLLNLVGRLSGVATQTKRYRDAMGPRSRAKLFDTRKTTPGLRVLEKYAVRCGGGLCHRIGLFDAVLIKDNHLSGVSAAELPGFVARAAHRARSLASGKVSFVECEVDSLEQLGALLTLPKGTLDVVLLDNMTPTQLTKACALRDKANPDLELEASGGVNLRTIASVARTGVDRISVGALTHSATQLDIGLDIREKPRAGGIG
jgi:nicotinate-nucleotide pyrophosphorylase (carboxylating)